jgi:cell division protein FtsX
VTLNLRDHFDRAVVDDPGAPLDEMAGAAIAEGDRLRRRRQHRTVISVAAAVVAVTGAVTGLTFVLADPRAAEPPVTLAAAMTPVTAASCQQQPVETDATDVIIFLVAGATDTQRSALDTALRADPRVDTVLFDSREQAYQRFRTRFAQNQDLIDAVGSDQFPESFRLRLGAAEQYAAFRARYAALDGVALIDGRRCTKDAPVGGVL